MSDAVPMQCFYMFGRLVGRSPHDHPTPPGGCGCAYCKPPPPPPPPPPSPPAADAPKAMKAKKGKFAKKVGAAVKAMKA